MNNIEVVEESNKDTSPAQIHLTIHSAKDLPKMDVTSAGDPYVIIKYGSIEFRYLDNDIIINPYNKICIFHEFVIFTLGTKFVKHKLSIVLS